MHGSSNFLAANNLENHLNQSERPLSIYDNLASALSPTAVSSFDCNSKEKPPEAANGSSTITVSSNLETQPNSKILQLPGNTMSTTVTRSNSSNSNKTQPYILDKPVGSRIQDIELQDMENNKAHLNFQRKSDEYPNHVLKSNGEAVNHIKPAISDAKSKFFGLSNGQQRADISTNEDHCSRYSVSESSEIRPMIEDHPVNSIVQPRYQNIPANSALFRKQNNTNTSATMTASPGFEEARRDAINENCISSDSDSSGRMLHIDDRLDHSNRSTKYDMSQPSQIVYMATTVPQNIKGSNIAGRHTPTRNSLRHSRMLVVNTNYQGGIKPNPLRLTHPSSTRTVLILNLIIGILINCIGIWITIWAPNTRTQDNPYWSGLTLLCASSLGLFTQQFRREKRQKYREGCFCTLKVLVILLTCIATILCATAFVFATIHYASLTAPETNCSSANILIINDACTCVFKQDQHSSGNNTTINETQTLTSEFQPVPENAFHYIDLSCTEVTGQWLYILLASIILNASGFLFGACFFILLFWKRRKSTLYTTVRSNPF